jgi:ABC-type multidrug transport system permease subunit
MVVPVLGESKILFYKELAAGMYHPITFVTGLLMAEIPWLVGIAFLHTLIFYPIIQLYDDPGYYFQYFLAMFLFATVFCFFGQMMSALLPTTRSASLAVSAMMVRYDARCTCMCVCVYVCVCACVDFF